jgi:DNA polymerase-3 subunit gamma/tau
MLSKSAFNALLKTLEEPPEHVKFILATTEAEKVLPTILSRCQRYDFRNIPTREIAGHLKNIVTQEKVAADDDALLLVAKAGAGSMRDALSLLDRLLSIGEDRLTVESLEQLLGLPKSQLLFDLAEAIGAGDTKSVLKQADSVITGGLSPDSLVAALVDHLRNLLILRTCGGDSDLVEVPGLSPADLQRQAERFDPVALTQDIAVLEELRRHMRQSQGGRALLDATLVRMTLADQFASIGDLLARLDGNGGAPRPAPRPTGSGVAPRLPVQSPAQKKNDVADAALPPDASRGGSAGLARAIEAVPVAPPPAAPGTPTSPIAAAPAPVATPPAPATAPVPQAVSDFTDEDEDDLPAVGKVWDNSGPSVLELLKQRQQGQTSSDSPAPPPVAPAPSPPAPADANVEPVARQDLPKLWKDLLADLTAKTGPALPAMLAHGRLADLNGEQAVIRYGAGDATFVRMLDRNGKKDVVRDALSNLLQRPVGVAFEIDAEVAPAAPGPAAPAAGRPAPPPRRPAPPPPPREEPPSAPVQRVTPEMVEQIRSTQPLVKALMDGLNAQVIKVE